MNGRIIGGENTKIETHPYQISLERFGRHSCGGSIISSTTIITAGHCVDSAATDLTVRTGTTFKGRGGQVHRVDSIVRHENFSTNGHGVPLNDVALLKLFIPIVFGKTRRPIKLFDASQVSATIEPGTKAVITGWGRTSTGTTDRLQSVVIPIIDRKLCSDAYRQYGGLPEGQICAAYYGKGGKDSCQGDSGGPLVIDGKLAGIVSWGNGCAFPYYPGVYTEVAHFRSWIDEHV